MVIDVNSGNIYDSTLEDIIAERQVLTNLVANPADKQDRRFIGTIFGYVIAGLTILFMTFAAFYFFAYDSPDLRSMALAVVIGLLYFIAIILGGVGWGKKSTSETYASYGLAGVATLLLIALASYNSTNLTSWLASPASPAGSTPPIPAAAGISVAPPQTMLDYLKQKIPVYGVIAALSCLGGFVIGMAFTNA